MHFGGIVRLAHNNVLLELPGPIVLGRQAAMAMRIELIQTGGAADRTGQLQRDHVVLAKVKILAEWGQIDDRRLVPTFESMADADLMAVDEDAHVAEIVDAESA